LCFWRLPATVPAVARAVAATATALRALRPPPGSTDARGEQSLVAAWPCGLWEQRVAALCARAPRGLGVLKQHPFFLNKGPRRRKNC
jgi:hypothetical protein